MFKERIIAIRKFPTLLTVFSLLSGFGYLFMVNQEKLNATGTTYNPLELSSTFHRSHRLTNSNLSNDPTVEVIVAFSEELEPHSRSHFCPVDRPNNDSITWDSNLWQRIEYENIYLWTGYYDDRYSFRGNSYHFIRIISIVRESLSIDLTCYLWTQNSSQSNSNGGAITTSAIGTELWLDIWGKGSSVTLYKAYLLSCLVPEHIHYKVTGVSVSSHACSKPETYIPIEVPKPKLPPPPTDLWLPDKKHFAVCVKALDYNSDISARLTEWLEMQFILGADVVNIYLYSIHPDTANLLDHYVTQGKVKLYQLDLPGQLPNDPVERSQYLQSNVWQKRRLELIPYNDCLYRHIYTHQFVVPVDIDEVIVPVKDYDWKSLLTRVLSNDPKSIQVYPSFSVQNTYYLESYSPSTSKLTNSQSKGHLSNYLYMINHINRSINFSIPGYAVKSFISTNTSLALFNHYTLFPLYPTMKRNALISTSLAQLNHYKSECPRTMFVECAQRFNKHWKVDKILWKYKKPLIVAINKTIQLIKSNHSSSSSSS